MLKKYAAKQRNKCRATSLQIIAVILHTPVGDNDSSRGFYYRRVFIIITVKMLLHAVVYEYQNSTKSTISPAYLMLLTP